MQYDRKYGEIKFDFELIEDSIQRVSVRKT